MPDFIPHIVYEVAEYGRIILTAVYYDIERFGGASVAVYCALAIFGVLVGGALLVRLFRWLWDMRPVRLGPVEKDKLARLRTAITACIFDHLGPLGLEDLELQLYRGLGACVWRPGHRKFKIALGTDTLRNLSQAQVCAVGLHECGHIKQTLEALENGAVAFAPTNAILRAANHRSEFEADIFAASYVGAGAMINALKRTAKMARKACGCKFCVSGGNHPGDTHPTLSQRVKRLREWKLEKEQAEEERAIERAYADA